MNRTRFIVSATAMIGTVVGCLSASAADLGSPAEPAPSFDIGRDADTNWSGLYLGLRGGFGRGEELWTFTSNNHQTDNGLGGAVGGLDLSYLRQNGHTVVGLTGSADFARLTGTNSCPNIAYDCSSRIDGLESARAVLGLAAGSWLAYGTAGLGAEQVSESAHDGFEYKVPRRTKFGWVFGGGVQTMLTSRITLGAEYLHYSFPTDGRQQINETTGLVDTSEVNFRESADVVEARLGIKLDAPDEHVPLK